MKKIIITVAVAVVLCAFAGWRAFLDPVPVDRLALLKKGMTKTEVEATIGKPTKIYDSGQWIYMRPIVFGYVNIPWQSDGTYDGNYNYERY